MADDFDIEGFKKWLTAQGAIHQTPTNEWEVMRYKGTSGTLYIVWRTKKGSLTIPEPVRKQYKAFLQDMNLAGPEAVEKVRRAHGRQRDVLLQQIFDRDCPNGERPTCCYCGQFLEEPPVERFLNITVEHFCPKSTGGPNHANNCAMACEPCNKAAGDLSVQEKIALRETIREAITAIPPWETFVAADVQSLKKAETA